MASSEVAHNFSILNAAKTEYAICSPTKNGDIKKAISIIKELLTGIMIWAYEEDGVHDACYDAYYEARQYLKGKEDQSTLT